MVPLWAHLEKGQMMRKTWPILVVAVPATSPATCMLKMRLIVQPVMAMNITNQIMLI